MISQELTLTTSQFEAALERVTKLVEAKSQRMQRSFKGAGSGGIMGGMLGGIGGSIAGAGTDLLGAVGLGGGLTGVAMLGKQALSYADDIADLTLALNDNAESLQRVDYAGQLAAGQGVQEIASAMLKLERALGEVENKKAAEALQNLGLNVQELQAMSLDEKILALSAAFQKARASGTGLADIQALLGRSAAELVPLFEQGDEALRAMFEAAPVVADATIQKMAEINDQFDGLILKSKSWVVETGGALAGINQFLGEFYAGILEGNGVGAALEQALLAQADRDVAGVQSVAERERKREENAKAQADARDGATASADDSKAMAAADKAEEEIVKRREEDRKRREDEARERDAQRKDYQTARFETLTPEQQMEVMLDKIERATGKRSADESFVASAADVAAQLGDFQGATNLLGMLSTLRGITSRIGGMDRVQSVEQGSMSRLMDKIFGRENRELEAIAKNTNASNTTLDNIYQNLLQPPPRDTFDDF